MTDDHQTIPDSLNELSEGMDELADGLADLSSGESDASDWKARFAAAWKDLSSLAQGREGVTQFIFAWMPVVLATRSLGATLWGLGDHLRGAVMDGESFELSDDFLEELRADFDEMTSAFPDAATILFGVDRLDELIDDVLANEDVRVRFVTFGSELLKLGDGLISRALDIVLSADKQDLSALDFASYLGNLEKVVQKVLDRMMPL